MNVTILIVVSIVLAVLFYFLISYVCYLHNCHKFKKVCTKIDEKESVTYKKIGKVIVAGLGFNISKTMASIKDIVKSVNADYVVIVENNSSDNSRLLLEEWKKDAPFPIILPVVIEDDERTLKGKSCQRIQRMVRLRNVLLDTIRDNIVIDDNDTLVLLDLDMDMVYSKSELNQRIRILHTLNTNVLAADFRVFRELCGFTSYVRDPFALKKNKKHTDGRFKEVASAFGGLALYKIKPALDARYIFEINETKPSDCLCEHVGFHRQLGGVWIDTTWRLMTMTQE